ncbi:MAG: hypothetical protein E6K63_03130 [Nitrospirae bacterium]|nr:MAG: hypothetical protein E6K63_03130 [Nitrospirota bacterium]
MAPARTTKKARLCSAVIAIVSVAVFVGCATTQPDDPLKQTKKLVKEGHISLYNNGAFRVPHTSIRLIPPGPSTIELAIELIGIRARHSFLLALTRARDSVYIVSEGTTLTFRVAKGMHEATGHVADEIKQFARDNSTLLIYRGSMRGREIIGKSWEFSKETAADLRRYSVELAQRAQVTGDKVGQALNEEGTKIVDNSLEMAAELTRGGQARSAAAISSGIKGFIEGYATIPSKMKSKGEAVGAKLDQLNLAASVSEDNEQRGQWSKKMIDLIGQTLAGYPSDVAKSFRQGGMELADYHTTGISLAALRSLRWVLQGLLWDAIVEPVGKISTASIGYIGVNAVAFPVMVVARGGTATTELAVEVGWNASKAGYELVAPTGMAAVAGIYSLLDFTGSNVGAAALTGTGTLVGYSEKGLSHVASVVVKGSGYAAGKTIQYFGVPLAAASIAVGGGTVGVAAGTAVTVTGGGLRVTGEVASVSTHVFGNTLAGTTIATGAAASVAAAAAYGYYELNKAVIVPAGYGLGGGLVLNYGTLSHLGAHTILAASDFAYLVLSLEGPRWVIYAVRGKLGKGEDLAPGTVLNLEKMREAGEELYYLPVSDEEMKNVVNSIDDELPEVE